MRTSNAGPGELLPGVARPTDRDKIRTKAGKLISAALPTARKRQREGWRMNGTKRGSGRARPAVRNCSPARSAPVLVTVDDGFGTWIPRQRWLALLSTRRSRRLGAWPFHHGRRADFRLQQRPPRHWCALAESGFQRLVCRFIPSAASCDPAFADAVQPGAHHSDEASPTSIWSRRRGVLLFVLAGRYLSAGPAGEPAALRSLALSPRETTGTRRRRRRNLIPVVQLWVGRVTVVRPGAPGHRLGFTMRRRRRTARPSISPW